MSDFKAKMHQIYFRQSPLGELTETLPPSIPAFAPVSWTYRHTYKSDIKLIVTNK